MARKGGPLCGAPVRLDMLNRLKSASVCKAQYLMALYLISRVI